MTNSATTVQRLWNYCNVLRDDGGEIEKELDQAQARSERLQQSILKRAFEGRLV